MRLGERYVNRRRHNLLIMVLVIMTSLYTYTWLDILSDKIAEAREPVSPLSNIKFVMVEREVDRIVPVPLNCEGEVCEILAYIVEVFQEDAADAITIVNSCENSSFDQSAVNYNNNNTSDHGIFQLNSIHIARFGDAFVTDWKANVDVAYQIFKERGWTAWSCAHEVGVTPFWQL